MVQVCVNACFTNTVITIGRNCFSVWFTFHTNGAINLGYIWFNGYYGDNIIEFFLSFRRRRRWYYWVSRVPIMPK
jgi:hypothetical protein